MSSQSHQTPQTVDRTAPKIKKLLRNADFADQVASSTGGNPDDDPSVVSTNTVSFGIPETQKVFLCMFNLSFDLLMGFNSTMNTRL
jgi:hypothetical protein